MSAANVSIGFEHWSDFLFQLGAICGPAELQGQLVGLLCTGQRLSDEQWLARAQDWLDLPEPVQDEAQRAGLGALYSLVFTALDDGDYAFTLLLPDDALPLKQRTQALAQWCQGFLLGLGDAGPALAALPEDLQEAMADLAQIAQLELTQEESEENEVYFAELVEYSRVAALGLYAELAQAQPANPGALH